MFTINDKTEVLDRIDAYDYECVLNNGKQTAIGLVICGELVAYYDVEENDEETTR
jgi:hypothetical protein